MGGVCDSRQRGDNESVDDARGNMKDDVNLFFALLGDGGRGGRAENGEVFVERGSERQGR